MDLGPVHLVWKTKAVPDYHLRFTMLNLTVLFIRTPRAKLGRRNPDILNYSIPARASSLFYLTGRFLG